MSNQWTSTNYPPEFLAAFRAAAKPGEKGSCWLWPGCPPDLYGLFHAHGVRSRTHRASYAAFVADPPAHLVVRHRCDTPACWNPEHLLLGTHQDNMDDKAARGRSAIEDRHSQRKITSADAVRIVRAYNDGGTARLIARQYGLDESTVWAILMGRTWKAATSAIPRVEMDRTQFGEAHHRAQLTAETARLVAEGYIAGATVSELAGRFGVHRSTISCVISRRTWRAQTADLPLGEVDGKARQLEALARARAARSAQGGAE